VVSQEILKQKGKYAYLIASKNVAHAKITEYIRTGLWSRLIRWKNWLRKSASTGEIRSDGE